MTTATAALSTSPVLRTAVSPAYGVMAIRAYDGGYEATPVDPTLAWRDGLAGLYAPDMESIVHYVHDF